MSSASPSRDPKAAFDTGPVGTDTGIVVSPHHLASRAGSDVLDAGGSAADAAIAVNAVLGVVLPDTCGLGGDLFALIHVPGDASPHALNSSGRAGAAVSAADVRRDGHVEMPLRSPWSVTVPGCVDGWEALHARFGRLPLRDVLSDAIGYARSGFPVSRELADSLHRILPLIGGQPSAPPLYPGGSAPDPGSSIVRPRLAETLEGIASAGREAFYAGPPGAGIVDATDGLITPADLEQRQSEWVEPVGLEVFGSTGWTMPPNSQGYLTLAAAYLLERLAEPGTSGPERLHAEIEAYRAVAWERDDVVSDPLTAPMAGRDLVDAERLDHRLDRIDTATAARWPGLRDAPGGTAYMCARDRDGMGVSLIQSNFHGIGSGLSAGATGVFLHNRGAGFSLVPGHPNELAPGRRPLHTLSPSLWSDRGTLRALLGTRGGHYQPQLLLQVAAKLWWDALDPVEALAAPRWVSDGWGPDDVSRVHVEDRMPAGAVAGLEARGHAVHRAGAWEPGWGPVSLVITDADSVRGVADPRVSTATATASR